MPEQNRFISRLDNAVEFGDPLIANIAGTSARVTMRDPLYSAFEAFNIPPFTYSSNTFTNEQDGILSQIPTPVISVNDDIVKSTSGIGIIDQILGHTSLDEAATALVPDPYERVKHAGIYILAAIIGLILIIFGLKELTK